MFVSEVGDDRNKKREDNLTVGFEDGEEVVIFEEAHGSVGYLQVGATDTFDDPFEQFVDQGL